MKNIFLLGLAVSVAAGCAGIERINTKHKTDSQLKLRLSQTEREMAAFRSGDTALHDFSMLESERDAIERELLSRCEAGDQDACLPHSLATKSHFISNIRDA
jgi:hypothetical protein